MSLKIIGLQRQLDFKDQEIKKQQHEIQNMVSDLD